VANFSELRSRLAPAGAEMHVIKNNFLKRAMADSGFPDVSDHFAGQTAVVIGEADVAQVAKIFKTFASEFKLAALKVGFVDRAVLSAVELETLAELPARELLQVQLLGLLLSPATRLVRLFSEPGAALARLLNAKAEKEGAPAA
jgi:large subunit ribosomal protein L10